MARIIERAAIDDLGGLPRNVGDWRILEVNKARTASGKACSLGQI